MRIAIQGPFDFVNFQSVFNKMQDAINKIDFFVFVENRELLLFDMQNLPRYAGYDPKGYYDGYCKFLCLVIPKNPFQIT